MDKATAILIVQRYARLVKTFLPFEKMYLFGSYAKGTNNQHSDIDVAIVVNEIQGDYFTVNPILWKLRRQIDDRIEPLIIERKFDDAGFLNEIQKSGIEIN